MAKLRDILVGLALTLALLAPVWFLAGALGTKFGLLDWRVGFGLMTFRLGAPILMTVAGVATVALVLALAVAPRRGWIAALVALAIPAAGLGYAASVREAVKDIPPIHDITTDLADPPAFSSAVQAARAAVPGVNDLEPPAGEEADKHRAAYGDLQPILVPAPPEEALEIAADVARKQGWTITAVDPEAMIVEATVTSFWYGFTDDVVIRVRPKMEPVPPALAASAEAFEPREPDAAIVDLRSVSRVGRSDLGANAARLRAFRDALAATMNGAAMAG